MRKFFRDIVYFPAFMWGMIYYKHHEFFQAGFNYAKRKREIKENEMIEKVLEEYQ